MKTSVTTAGKTNTKAKPKQPAKLSALDPGKGVRSLRAAPAPKKATSKTRSAATKTVRAVATTVTTKPGKTRSAAAGRV